MPTVLNRMHILSWYDTKVHYENIFKKFTLFHANSCALHNVQKNSSSAHHNTKIPHGRSRNDPWPRRFLNHGASSLFFPPALLLFFAFPPSKMLIFECVRSFLSRASQKCSRNFKRGDYFSRAIYGKEGKKQFSPLCLFFAGMWLGKKVTPGRKYCIGCHVFWRIETNLLFFQRNIKSNVCMETREHIAYCRSVTTENKIKISTSSLRSCALQQ